MVEDGNSDVKACPLQSPGGVGRDLISSVPDDLLLKVLSLPTVEAIRTCVLSPNWRTLWTRLPELRFSDRDASTLNLRFNDLVDGALQGSGDTTHTLLEITISNAANLDVPRLATWVQAAASRATGVFTVSLSLELYDDEDQMILDLPCFPRSKEIRLSLKRNAEVRLLPMPSTGGAFACLTLLDLCTLRFGNGGASLSDLVSSRCPRLRQLRLISVGGVAELGIEANHLRELRLFMLPDLERLRVVAVELQVLVVAYCYRSNGAGDVAAGTELSMVAPKLEEVGWEGFCPQEMRVDANRRLGALSVSEFKPEVMQLARHTTYAKIMQHFSDADCLQLYISFPEDALGHKILMEHMKLPRHFDLYLYISRNGHAFGSTVASLLKRCNGILTLTCIMHDKNHEPRDLCSAECVCAQPASWRDETAICFESLEELAFYGFMGTASETDLLYFIFRCSSVLQTVFIKFGKHAQPSEEIRREIRSCLPQGCSLVFL